MPTVGTKKFKYTKAGKKAASAYAKRTGKRIVKNKKKGGGYGKTKAKKLSSY